MSSADHSEVILLASAARVNRGQTELAIRAIADEEGSSVRSTMEAGKFDWGGRLLNDGGVRRWFRRFRE
jgi:hypothetical protein